MSEKNAITKVPFYGNKIVVIEKNGKKYVAMKPIVQGLNLDWDTQFRNIKNDPVLSSTIVMMTMLAEDGKQREMVCLPLEYLNGWLFKVPASRYTGKKQETIIRYQKECYQALYDYFHNGAAINSRLDISKIAGLLEKALQRLDYKDEVIQKQEELLKAITSDSIYGELSEVTGAPKLVLVRQHFRSYAEPKPKKSKNPMQMVFDFFRSGGK